MDAQVIQNMIDAKMLSIKSTSEQSKKRVGCKQNSRRNPKTMRCRKVCPKKHRRNPKTKRCYKNCSKTQKRSPKTHRCKNKTQKAR